MSSLFVDLFLKIELKFHSIYTVYLMSVIGKIMHNVYDKCGCLCKNPPC